MFICRPCARRSRWGIGAAPGSWRTAELGKRILVFDCPFDIRRVAPENRELPDVDHPHHTRMMIQVHGIDGHGILRSLRGVTLSPELTSALLAAVMDQLPSATSPQPAIDRWQQLDPQLLLNMTRMSEW